jgi:hypothetical protein
MLWDEGSKIKEIYLKINSGVSNTALYSLID